MVSQDKWSYTTGRINTILERPCVVNIKIHVFLVWLPQSYSKEWLYCFWKDSHYTERDPRHLTSLTQWFPVRLTSSQSWRPFFQYFSQFASSWLRYFFTAGPRACWLKTRFACNSWKRQKRRVPNLIHFDQSKCGDSPPEMPGGPFY